jgi:hypothetical protein
MPWKDVGYVLLGGVCAALAGVLAERIIRPFIRPMPIPVALVCFLAAVTVGGVADYKISHEHDSTSGGPRLPSESSTYPIVPQVDLSAPAGPPITSNDPRGSVGTAYPARSSITLKVNGQGRTSRCITVHESGTMLSGTAHLIKSRALWFFLGSTTDDRLYEISGAAAVLDEQGRWQQRVYQVGDNTSRGVHYRLLAVLFDNAESNTLQRQHSSAGAKPVIFVELPPHQTMVEQCLVRA